jgi:anti-anti-sigma factor
MTSDDAALAEVVVRHLADVIAGTCTITHAELEAETDQSRAEILAGLMCLHDDLVFKESERVRAEAELREAAEKLARQNEELEENRTRLEAFAAELATPVIALWSGAILMPLVGSIDAARAQEAMEKILAAVVERSASHVILDLTGVTTIDTASADHLLRIVGAVRLVGAETILAGAQPSIATAIASIGIDLSKAVTARNLQAALMLCIDAADPVAEPGRASRQRIRSRRVITAWMPSQLTPGTTP